MSENTTIRWYVLRDLKRRNTNTPGYLELKEKGFEVFTPMKQEISVRGGKRIRKQVPVIADLLFVHSAKHELDEIIDRINTLQYRYKFGHTIHEPMTVRDADMRQFIDAVSRSTDVRYYRPDEITPEMYGKEISVIGGPFDGFSGKLLSLRGSKKRRLIVEIPGFIAAAVEVQPEYIEYQHATSIRYEH